MNSLAFIAILLAGQVVGSEEPAKSPGKASENSRAEKSNDSRRRGADDEADLSAIRRLSEAFRAGTEQELQAAEANYCTKVLASATARALASNSGWQELRVVVERQQGLLRSNHVPDEFVQATQIYLAQFLYNRPQSTPLPEVLDKVADAMASPRVWAGLRGMYWNLCGLVATNELSFALAIDCHTRALELRREIKADLDEAQSLNNLGYLFVRMGDYATAKHMLSEACALYAAMRQAGVRDSLPVEIQARMNAARAAAGVHDFATAAEELDSLLALATELPADWRGMAECYLRNNLANVRYSLGQYAACDRELLVATELANRVLPDPEKTLRLAELSVNRGWLALANGQNDGAERHFGNAVAAFKANPMGGDRAAESLAYWARAKALLKADGASRALLDEALELRRAQLQATLASALSERDRLAYVQQLRVHPESLAWPGALDTYLELAPRLSISAEDQYRQVLVWKGVLSQTWQGSASDGELRSAAELMQRRARLRHQLLGLAPAVRAKEAKAVEQYSALERETNGLDRQIRKIRGTATVSLTPPSIDKVASALPLNSALLDIIEVRRYRTRAEGEPVGDDRYYLAFLVRNGGGVSRIDLGESSLIDAAVRDYLERIKKRQSFTQQAQVLAELFAKRLRSECGAIESLVVSADGALQHLPWCALPGLNKPFWVQELTVTQVASGQSLVRRSQQAATPSHEKGNVLIVGDVDYGIGEGTWQALTATAAEAVQVERLLSSAFGQGGAAVQRLTGKAATKGRLVELLPQQRFAHLATHGDFFHRHADAFSVQDAAAGLDSSLVLAGANQDASGGFESLLTAEEVGSLRLQQLQLIVLSACETGLGQIQAGQGQVGLLAALDKAGAGSVVASLWKVDDAATAALMEGFYGELLKRPHDLAVASALRSAQVRFIEAAEKPELPAQEKGSAGVAANVPSDGATRGATRKNSPQPVASQSHPFYWAAWTVSGCR